MWPSLPSFWSSASTAMTALHPTSTQVPQGGPEAEGVGMGLEPAAAPATSGPEAVVGAPARLRIFVADSHPGVLEALGDVIGDQPDLTLVGEAATAPTLIASPALRDADVLVLDLALGPGLIEQARAVAPSLRVVAQSILPREPFEGAAMRAGESAFVAKGEHPAALLAAIRMHGNS